MVRSLVLSLLLAWPLSAVGADLCAFPGRDGAVTRAGVVNLWLASPDDTELRPGSRWVPVAAQRGEGELTPGDVLLLVQMQGAEMETGNDEFYGVVRDPYNMVAGQFELLRVEALEPGRIGVRGSGPDGGIRYHYRSQEPRQRGDQGRLRWQAVRVPQFDSLTLSGDLLALPWDGRSGGVLALDVRDSLRLDGHDLRAATTGFRGGAGLSLFGAVGDDSDYRYVAPGPLERQAGYGQHASKGEGLAGTPRWLAGDPNPVDTLADSRGRDATDGYPFGSFARGAPANAGGGANSLSADNRAPAGGGGGAGGESGHPGKDAAGAPRGGLGGAGVVATLPRLLAGGGGGAGTRSQGADPQGSGGSGGGIVFVRAGRLEGAGRFDVRGAPGVDSREGGGGGGGGGTLLVMAGLADTAQRQWLLDGGPGGAGAAAGGAGGRGRLLQGGGALQLEEAIEVVADDVAGVAAGYRCRPTGMLLSGQVFDDNGRGAAQAHDGRRQVSETGLAGVAVVVRDGTQVVAQTHTGAHGLFSLELPETLAGRSLTLEVAIPDGWHVMAARSNDLPLAPFRWQGNGRWQFTAQRAWWQEGLTLALIRAPLWQVPTVEPMVAGSTRLYQFRYVPHTRGRVRFHYQSNLSGASGWRHRLLLDPACQETSRYFDEDTSRWLPVQPDEPVCVRVRVDAPERAVPGADLTLQVTAETDLGETPLGLQLAPLQTKLVIPLAP